MKVSIKIDKQFDHLKGKKNVEVQSILVFQKLVIGGKPLFINAPLATAIRSKQTIKER
jgi:hypothetical protein